MTEINFSSLLRRKRQKYCVRTQKGITFALVKMKQEILSMRDEKSYIYKKDEKSQVQEMEGFR